MLTSARRLIYPLYMFAICSFGTFYPQSSQSLNTACQFHVVSASKQQISIGAESPFTALVNTQQLSAAIVPRPLRGQSLQTFIRREEGRKEGRKVGGKR